MNRPNLANYRSLFPTETLGVCVSDPKVRNYCNESQERLLMDPLCPDEGWWGGWVGMTFSASVAANNAAYITTPPEVARLTDVAVCGRAIPMRNGFYEYLQFGAGLQPKTCNQNVCGSTFATYRPGQRLHAVPAVADAPNDPGLSVRRPRPEPSRSAPGPGQQRHDRPDH